MIQGMPKPRPPYLQRHLTRHGSVIWYVKPPKRARVRIRGVYGTPEFMDAYQAAMAGKTPRAAKAPHKAPSGTLGWLIARYRETVAWTSLGAATRRQRENVFKHVIKASGDLPFADVSRKHIVAGIDRRRETPAAARHFLETMRGLFAWAANAEHVPADPTQGVKAPKKKGKGYHAWTIEECEAFEARWPVGTRERLAFDLLLYTGLRRGDAVKIGRPHVRDGVITTTTEKSGEMVKVVIPILPPLATSIEAAPCGELTFIAGERGRPMVKESFGNWFREACRAAGVPGSAHGLRKVGASRAAEAGATEHELMAMFGWVDPATAAIYTRAARRDEMARAGSRKLERFICGRTKGV